MRTFLRTSALVFAVLLATLLAQPSNSEAACPAGWTGFGTCGNIGTAGLASTGTSGHAVPFLDGANTHSGGDTFSGIVNFTSTFDVAGFTITWPGVNATLAYQSGVWVAGHCLQAANTAGGVSDAGAACGSGSGSSAFSAITGSTNTTAAMLVGTGASLGPTGSGVINATEINGDGNVSFLDVNQAFTKGQAVTPDTASSCGTITNGGTATPNFQNSNSCELTFNSAASATMSIAAPTNTKAGQTYQIEVIQGSGGSGTVTSWNAFWDFGTAGAPTFSTTGGKADLVSCRVPSANTKAHCVLAGTGF